MSQQPLIQLTLVTKLKKAERLTEATDFFVSQGFDLAEISSFELKSQLKISVFVSSLEKKTQVKKQFDKTFKAGWAFEFKPLGQSDWLTKWQDDYKISALGQKFSIVPEWKKEEYRGRRIPIFLNPEAAFGSGTHQTTKLMTKLLEEYFKESNSFLDVGTGTGVLSVVAHHLGAKEIRAFDHDVSSVKTAKKNLKLNHIQKVSVEKVDVFKDQEKKCYDVVAANMISKILEESQDILFAKVKKDGLLIVSGIVRKNFEGFLKRFKSTKFKRVKTVYARS